MDPETAWKTLVGFWLKMVEAGIAKKKPFQDDADVCMQFFNGPYDFMYGEGDSPMPRFLYAAKNDICVPSMKMTVNKVAEGVQLFGPALYHRNPTRKVNPRQLPKLPAEVFGDPTNPMTMQMLMPFLQQMRGQNLKDKTRAALIEWYQNYLPEAINLKREMRRMIDQAIITGMGAVWHTVKKPDGSNHKLPWTEQENVDHLLVDPDQEKFEDAMWIMEKCCKPRWEIEKEYGHAPGSLKGNSESSQSWASEQSSGKGHYERKTGKTNDLITYWKIWSKMGIGSLLTGIGEGAMQLDRYGKYLHLVVCDSHPFFLNVPQAILQNEDEVKRRLQWETPYWADGAWPVTTLVFHEVPGSIWPMSHFRPAMGELQFINWAYSFLISKIHVASRDFIAIAKAAGEDLKHKILKGRDFELLEFESSLGKSIDQVVGFLQHPPFHGDIYKVIQGVEANFEKRTGLTELMYGESSRQMRSAAESQLKEGQLQVRPDDMAQRVEETATEIARREALTMRWHLDGSDIEPVAGPVIANMWQQLVATADINEIIHQLEYRIEADSAKKPNKGKMADDANTAMQTLGPILQQYAMAAGDVKPLNALIEFWGKALDVDVEKMLLQPPPPPMPGPMPGQPPGGPPGAAPQPAGPPAAPQAA